MVNIKIICGCGQKYSFDVYPLNRRMPAPVQCPVCGMDGTAAANEIMARMLEAPGRRAATVPTLNSPVSGNEVNQPRNCRTPSRIPGNGARTCWPEGATSIAPVRRKPEAN